MFGGSPIPTQFHFQNDPYSRPAPVFQPRPIRQPVVVQPVQPRPRPDVAVVPRAIPARLKVPSADALGITLADEGSDAVVVPAPDDLGIRLP